MIRNAEPEGLTTVEATREAAERAGLRYVTDEGPGIRRRGRGKGFSYYGPGGELIQDAEERDRLNALAVPPAWKDVWICPDARTAHSAWTARSPSASIHPRIRPASRRFAA